ncbi:hypothetical protein FO519_000175 [Halicephalobus sp. NKZ332]|nr:hypothetical protein FO519_000175 [Halicephalobus sp. NKZ332]
MSTNEEFRKSVIVRTTSTKFNGFNRYTKLPERSTFENVCYVFSENLEIKIKKSGILFNHETPWERRPIYFNIFKGLLLIYMENAAGYALKIPLARGLQFEGTRINGGRKGILYKAIVKISYSFGEIHLRFKEGDDVRAWRTLLLAAHQFPATLTSISVDVCKKLQWKDSSSVISIHSLQDTDPEFSKDVKNKRNVVVVTRRHVAQDAPEGVGSLGEEKAIQESFNANDSVDREREDEENPLALKPSGADSSLEACPGTLEATSSEYGDVLSESNLDSYIYADEERLDVPPNTASNADKERHNHPIRNQPLGLNKVRSGTSIDSIATTVEAQTPVKVPSLHCFGIDSTHDVSASPFSPRVPFVGSKSTGNLRNSEIMQFWRTKESCSMEETTEKTRSQKQRRVTFNFGPGTPKLTPIRSRVVSSGKLFNLDDFLQGCDESHI